MFSEPIDVKVGLLFENVLTEWNPIQHKGDHFEIISGVDTIRHVHKVIV